MAEILSYGVNLIKKDSATSNGNTILGSAVPTDSATEGVQKEAGQTGIFVYTDKSFTVYFHHGSQWVEYMSVDVTDADWTGSVNIPWAAHDTHGAVDTMYFKTDEASHEMRLVTFTTPIFVDATPGDSDLTYDGLIIDIDGPSENVDETLYGSETEFVRFEKLDASSYTEGETIIFTKSGKYNNSYVVIDGVDIPSTELYTGDPSYSTQISFIVPNGITPTSVVDVFFDQEYVYIPATVRSGILFEIDPDDPACYPGSGNVITSLVDATNVGTMNGVTITSNSVAGSTGNLMYWTDTANYGITFNNSNGKMSSAEMTIEFWVYTIDDQQSHDCVYSVGDLATTRGVDIRMNGGTNINQFEVRSVVSTGFMYSRPSGGAWTNGQWTHMVVGLKGTDKTDCKLYSNLSDISSTFNDTYHDNNPFCQSTTENGYIGMTSNGGGNFDDYIGEIRVYNRILSAAEIQSNYDATKGKYGL